MERGGGNPQGVRLSMAFVLYALLRALGQDPSREEMACQVKSSETIRVNEDMWRCITRRLGPQPAPPPLPTASADRPTPAATIADTASAATARRRVRRCARSSD